MYGVYDLRSPIRLRLSCTCMTITLTQTEIERGRLPSGRKLLLREKKQSMQQNDVQSWFVDDIGSPGDKNTGS